MDSSSLAHCKWECQYHIVFIPKFRRKKLYGMVKDDVRDIIKTLCGYKKVEIIAGAVCADHVHLCVSIPPKLSISDFVGYFKGKSALMIFDKHPELGSKWDRSFWARGVLRSDGRKRERRNRERIHQASDRRIHERRQEIL